MRIDIRIKAVVRQLKLRACRSAPPGAPASTLEVAPDVVEELIISGSKAAERNLLGNARIEHHIQRAEVLHGEGAEEEPVIAAVVDEVFGQPHAKAGEDIMHRVVRVS